MGVRARISRQGRHIRPTKAARLYAHGLSLRRIGERLGCSPATVRSALIDAGVTLRSSRSTPDYEQRARACELRDMGWTFERIGAALGISRQAARTLYRREMEQPSDKAPRRGRNL